MSSPPIWERALLKISDVSVDYAGAVALAEVSLTVGDGELVGLIGGNGAGKTTLLKAISGLVTSSGTIIFEGKKLSGLPAHAIPSLGIAHVPEGRRLFPYLSVEDNLGLGAFAGEQATAEQYERVYTIFPKLAERRDQMAGTLSGGEQQMAAIARGIIGNPRILLLDEPSLGLAPVLVETIYETIDELRQNGQTILLAEQNVAKCLDLADRTYVLQTGRVVHEGASDELRASDEVRRAFLGL